MLDFIKQYWLEVIFTGAVTALSFLIRRLYTRVQQELATQKLLREGMVAMLHDRLYSLCTEYISKGEITVEELSNLEYLYRSYHDLGGNGTGTELYNRCKSLKIVES